jgi:DUF971 family protein
MSHSTSVEPVSLKADGPDRLVIEWSDGHRDVFSWAFLRQHCPCAVCRAEAEKPKPLLPVLKVEETEPPRPTAMEPVGRYAYQISWRDGHSSGIYSFDYLLELAGRQPASGPGAGAAQ